MLLKAAIKLILRTAGIQQPNTVNIGGNVERAGK